MATYISFDCETSMRGERRDPSPFVTSNIMLCSCVHAEQDGKSSGYSYIHTIPDIVRTSLELLYGNLTSKKDFLIGHNMKFDIQHLVMAMYRNRLADSLTCAKVRKLWDASNGQWWDTSIAHYVLSGQVDTFPSLATALDNYEGIAKKDDFLSNFLKANPESTSEDADAHELVRYCMHDATTTLVLAKRQMQEAISRGMFALIISMCDALRAVVEMEINGLQVNLRSLDTALDTYEVYHKAASYSAYNSLMVYGGGASLFDCSFEIPNDADDPINEGFREAVFGSNQSVSHLFFGSETPKEYKIVIGKRPNGTNKWGKFTQKPHKGIYTLPKDTALGSDFKRNKSGEFPVDKDVLNRIKAHAPEGSLSHNVAHDILEYRESHKIHSTYLQPIPSMLRENNTIHHTLHQTSTSTGRLSASKPNFQNQPNVADVKRIFVPSTDSEVFIEFDYKQLEVVAIAYITGDEALKRDISHSVDIHSKIGQRVLGRVPTKEERRDIKTIVFAMLYGSGINNLVATSGKPRGLIETVVDQFKRTYPGVFKHHRWQQDELSKEAVKLGKTDRDKVYLTSKTGRVYGLSLYRNLLPSGVRYAPSWTEVCNYPCQGFATADIVPTMLGVLLDSRNECPYNFNLRNTVHDSILISCELSAADAVHKFVKGVLENPYPHLKRLFNIDDFHLPLLVEASVGPNWGDMAPFKSDF